MKIWTFGENSWPSFSKENNLEAVELIQQKITIQNPPKLLKGLSVTLTNLRTAPEAIQDARRSRILMLTNQRTAPEAMEDVRRGILMLINQ